MYGGSAYGDQFFRFKASNGWNKYGIGEFHPLVKLTPSEYIDMFNRHNRAGAAYIAPFYLSVFDAAARPAAMAADLISPNNSQKGSRELYHAISELMHKE